MNDVELEQILIQELVFLDVKPFTNKAEMFLFLSKHLQKNKIIEDVNKFIQALEYRESLGSTYMGNFIALPHGRDCTVNKPSIVFCRCTDSFNYQSFDEEGDVKYIFMLAVDCGEGSNDNYLKMLSKLACLLAHQEFIDEISVANDYQDVIKAIIKTKRL